MLTEKKVPRLSNYQESQGFANSPDSLMKKYGFGTWDEVLADMIGKHGGSVTGPYNAAQKKIPCQCKAGHSFLGNKASIVAGSFCRLCAVEAARKPRK